MTKRQTKYIVKEERKLHWKILENKEKLDKYVVQKATTELGYTTRDMKETLNDTVTWLKENGRI